MDPQRSLFRIRPVRRGWMVLMALGSLLIHGCLVLLGAALWQPIDKPVEVPTTVVQIGDPEVRELVVPFDAPTPPPDMPTPPPDETPPPEDTPPPTEEPDMQEPDKPTPTPKPKTDKPRYAATPAPANAKRGPVAISGVVGGNPNGTKATGTPGGGGNAKVGWTKPRPAPGSYPAAARSSHVQGTVLLHVTSDASGHCTAEVTKSVGNAILDYYAKSFISNNWHGPPNATSEADFTFRLQ